MVVSRCKKVLVGVALALSAGVALAIVMLIQLVNHGISARDQPTGLEAFAARTVRGLAMPGDARRLKNPVRTDASTLAEARSHFADHCALCHGNDGRGKTAVGENLYPKAPDMTLSQTQELTDGELFYIITNGIRLTGMPAWGTRTEEDDRGTWQLVHFIRTLPTQTPAQLEEMKAMNPKSRAEFEQEEKARRWLEGGQMPDADVDHTNH